MKVERQVLSSEAMNASGLNLFCGEVEKLKRKMYYVV